MRSAGLLWVSLVFAFVLVGCPKDTATSSSRSAAPDPALTITMWAVLIADAEGVRAPAEVTVEASAMSGGLLFVEAPALLVDRPPEGWRRWTRIGDAAARARLGDPQWLLDAAAEGRASVRAVLTLTDEVGPEFLVNPVITVLGETTRRTWEGCLSVEGMRGFVERPDHVRVDALGRKGDPVAYELRGFPAVVVQHECDHLDGVIYIDKVLPRSLMFVREYRRWGPPEEYEPEWEEAVDDLSDDLVADGYQEEITDDHELLTIPTAHDP